MRYNTASREQSYTCKRGLDGAPRSLRLRSSETSGVQWSLHFGYADQRPARPGGSEDMGKGGSARTRIVCKGKALVCKVKDV
jgi:hypothetical protein